MASCRYCKSVTLPGDKICYTCGRVIASNREGGYRLEQQFDEGSKESTFMMTKQPRAKGIVMTSSGREKNIFKRRKNRFRSVALVAFVAFVMLSPQAREAMFGEFSSIDEFIASATATYLPYQVESTYTVSKTSIVQPMSGYGAERILLPPTLYSNFGQDQHFVYESGEVEENIVLQQTLKIEIIVDGQRYNIPTNGVPHKYYDGLGSSAPIVTNNGFKIWYPGLYDPSTMDDDEEKYYCNVANCVMVQPVYDGNKPAEYSFEATVNSLSYSWWDHTRVDNRVGGKEFGINVDNSGTISDYALRSSQTAQQFSNEQHFSDYGSYKIDATASNVIDAATQISQRLPDGLSDNVYAFARATFDYLHEKVVYDKLAPTPARTGPECLSANKGDCDEQTNAFLSILRTKGIPGWYVFGLLTDYSFSDTGWEAHAWGYIQLPLSDEWCEDKGITLSSCFVNAQVDVVNNKWLLSTTTAYVDWIEEYESKNAENVFDYYRPSSPGYDRDRSYSTIGSVDNAQGGFQVKKYPEYF